jgi:hypothetical protein
MELAVCDLLAFPRLMSGVERHTLDVILSVRLARLVVVDQGNDVEQVVFAQLLQTVRELLHVDVLIPPVLLLGRILATHAVRIGGTRLLQKGEQLGLRVAECLEKRVSRLHAPCCAAHSPLGAWPRSAPTGSSGRGRAYGRLPCRLR